MSATAARPLSELPVLDLSDPAAWQDVHVPLAELRERTAVAVTPDGVPQVLRHAEVEAVLKDPRFVAADLFAMSGTTSGPVWEWWQRVMFSQDPPAHTRIRSLVSRAFTPRAVEAPPAGHPGPGRGDPAPGDRARRARRPGRPRPPAAARRHLRPARRARGRPARSSASGPRPSAWPSSPSPTPRCGAGSSRRSPTSTPTSAASSPSAGPAPGDDMISRLIGVEEEGDRLSPVELVALVENLLFAGHDTTRGALAAMVVLFADPPRPVPRGRRRPAR